MKSEHAGRAAQQEADRQRWADDGGSIPEADASRAPAPARPPWRAVGLAAAIGFAVGWLAAPRIAGGAING